MIAARKIVFGLFLLVPLVGGGADNSVSALRLKAQLTLEELLTQRYRSALLTRLDKDAFTLAVLVEADLGENSRELTRLFPEEMALGDTARLQENYQSGVGPAPLRTLIKRIDIQVGLPNETPEEVRAATESWLRQKVLTEFGSRSVVDVVRKKAGNEKNPRELASLASEQFWQRFKELQFLASICVVCLALLAGIWLATRLMRAYAREQRKMALDLKEQTSALPTPEAASSEPMIPPPESHLPSSEVAEGEDVAAALGPLIRAMKPQLNPLLMSWRAAGESGLAKLAVFLEAANAGGVEFPLPESADESLRDSFLKSAKISEAQRRALLQQIYWEVLALQALGPKVLQRPFAFLADISAPTLRTLLEKKDPKERAILLLHCPPSLREAFLKLLTEPERKALVQGVFAQGPIPLAQMRVIEKKFESELGQAEQAREVQPGQMIGSLLEAFSAEEEIKLLKSMAQNPAVQNFLLTYPNLVLATQWPDEILSLLFRQAPPEEILTLLRLLPELTERALKVCPPKTAAVVEGDLAMKDTLSLAQRMQSLVNLKLKVKALWQEISAAMAEKEAQSRGASKAA